MEEIIEIFADAISSFILKSIALQEQNAIPGPDLREHAAVVVQTSHTLVKITRDVAETDYRNYPDIKVPILECADAVARAVDWLDECIGILYNESDRAKGWKKLVDSTKQIGMQTSKLLVVIYGAEQKRLERAANAALAALQQVKGYAYQPPEELRMKLKALADDTGDASSKVTQFNTFLGGRYQAEKEEDLKAQLLEAFNGINEHNQYLINDANEVLTAPADPQKRKGLVGTCDTLIGIIDRIMGNVRKPEDLDAFGIIENLFNSSNKAMYTGARGYADIGRTRPVDFEELNDAAGKLREAIIKVKNHRTYGTEDVLNNTNIASNRMAKFTELVDVMAHQPPVALQPKLTEYVGSLNRENGTMVSDTNEYVATQTDSSASSILGTGSAGTDVSTEMDSIKGSIKRTLVGAKDFMAAPGTPNFVPKAREVGGSVKDLLAAVNNMVEKVGDPTKTAALSQRAATAKQAIMQLVNAGKAVHADPNNPQAGQSLQQSVTGLQGSIRGLLAEATAVQQAAAKAPARAGPGPAATAAGGPANPQSRQLEGTADRILALIDDILSEVKPSFANARNLIGGAGQRAGKLPADQITNSMLQRLADDAIRALEQMKPYGTFTPAETLEALEYAVEAVDLFSDRLGTRAEAEQLAQLKKVLEQAVRGINQGNQSLIDNTENYIGKPTPQNDRELMGNICSLQDQIRNVLKEIRPDDLKPSSQVRYGQAVTPTDLARQAEAVKAGTAATGQFRQQMPAQTANAGQDTADKLNTFNAMVDKLATDTHNPAYKNILNDALGDLKQADAQFVRSANAYLDNPQSAQTQQGLGQACSNVDGVIDNLMAELMPEAQAARGAAPADTSPLALQALADTMKHDVGEVQDDYTRLPPKELVREAQTASASAANLAEGLKARAAQERNPQLKQALQTAAAQLADANAGMVDSTNRYIRNPNQPAAGQALEGQCDAMKRIADDIMAQLRPRAGAAPDKHGNLGKVTPKMVEELGRRVQAGLGKVKQRDGKAPGQKAGDAEASSALLEDLAHMLENMEGQTSRPAIKNKLRGFHGQLRDGKREVPNRANAHIDRPEHRPTAQALDSKCDDLHALVDKIIKDVKPKVQVAKAQTSGSESCTPSDLARAAAAAKAAVAKVRDGHKAEDPEVLGTQGADASAKVAEFQALVDARSRAERRPATKAALSQAVPKLESGNKRFVDGTNTFISDPADPTTSKEVVGSSDDLINTIDDVMGAVMPQSTWTDPATMRGNFGGKDNNQLKATFDEVRAAVERVKAFPAHEPGQVAGNTDDASQKLAAFTKMLQARAGESNVPSMKQLLNQGADDLTLGNKEMVHSSNAYLGNPDDPNNAEDLDGACELLLNILDDLWGEIDPTSAVPASVDRAAYGVRDCSPSSLEAMAERVKKAVGVVEQHRNHTAKQHVAATDEAAGLGACFAGMVDEHAGRVPHAQHAAFLRKAAGDLERANQRIVDATNANVTTGQRDPGAQREVDAACADMKRLVDEVMGEVMPRARPAQLGSGNVPANPKPSDIERAAREVIAACNTVQGFPKHTPKQTVGHTEDASRKVVDLADMCTAAGGKAPGQLSRILNEAARELGRGNIDLVDSTNAYVATPQDQASQQMVHDSSENLKRIAEDLLSQVKPVMAAPGTKGGRPIPGQVTLPMLKQAYDDAKASLDASKGFQNMAPKQHAAATERATDDAQYFKDLAQVKVNTMRGETKELNEALRALGGANQGLYDATNTYFADPNTGNERKLRGAGNELDNMLDTVMSSLQPKAVYTKPNFRQPVRKVTAEEVDAAATGLNEGSLANLSQFLHRDEDVVAADATAASAEIARMNELVHMKGQEKDLMAVTKAKLKDASADMDRRNKALVSATNKWIQNKDDPDAQQKLRNAIKNAKRQVNNAAAVVKDADRKLKSFEDQIDAAADAMRRAAAEWDADDEIVGAAMRIAEEMKKLAEAARRMDRQGIIMHARNIAALVKSEIVAYAKPIQSGCKDGVIRKNISAGVQALGNFSTQLKIIASVKAADIGTGADKTAENQLVACCQGISTSMRTTLKSTQSAKLRMK